MLVQPETGYSAFTLIQDLKLFRLEDHGNDIIMMHKEVRTLVRRIRVSQNGKEAIPDQTITYYLIQAYEKARCDEFKVFIELLKNDGTLELETLINTTEAKYIYQLKSKKWDPTPKDVILLALQAKNGST